MNTLAGRNQDPNNSLFRALGKRTKENIRTEDIKKEKLKGKKRSCIQWTISKTRR